MPFPTQKMPDLVRLAISKKDEICWLCRRKVLAGTPVRLRESDLAAVCTSCYDEPKDQRHFDSAGRWRPQT